MGSTDIPVHSQLHSKFRTSLGYIRPCRKKKGGGGMEAGTDGKMGRNGGG